jgi:hypothetical protein
VLVTLNVLGPASASDPLHVGAGYAGYDSDSVTLSPAVIVVGSAVRRGTIA